MLSVEMLICCMVFFSKFVVLVRDYSMYFADDIYDCFTKMCNWGKTPPGGFLPHSEGATYGARSPFWKKKKSSDRKNR